MPLLDSLHDHPLIYLAAWCAVPDFAALRAACKRLCRICDMPCNLEALFVHNLYAAPTRRMAFDPASPAAKLRAFLARVQRLRACSLVLGLRGATSELVCPQIKSGGGTFKDDDDDEAALSATIGGISGLGDTGGMGGMGGMGGGVGGGGGGAPLSSSSNSSSASSAASASHTPPDATATALVSTHNGFGFRAPRNPTRKRGGGGFCAAMDKGTHHNRSHCVAGRWITVADELTAGGGAGFVVGDDSGGGGAAAEGGGGAGGVGGDGGDAVVHVVRPYIEFEFRGAPPPTAVEARWEARRRGPFNANYSRRLAGVPDVRFEIEYVPQYEPFRSTLNVSLGDAGAEAIQAAAAGGAAGAAGAAGVAFGLPAVAAAAVAAGVGPSGRPWRLTVGDTVGLLLRHDGGENYVVDTFVNGDRVWSSERVQVIAFRVDVHLRSGVEVVFCPLAEPPG
jgi:hypothetical protein